MSCNLFPSAYEKLIAENIEWLIEATKQEPNSLERDHIIRIMEASAKDYREFGYEKAMNQRITS